MVLPIRQSPRMKRGGNQAGSSCLDCPRFARGDPRWLSVQFMKTTKVDPMAATLMLNSFGDVDVKALKSVNVPTLVLCGAEDRDNGSPDALAKWLPDAQLAEVPGTHMGCVVRRELGEAMADFLSA